MSGLTRRRGASDFDFGSHKKNSSRQHVAVTAVKASAEDQEVSLTFAAFPNIQILHLTFCITSVFSDFYGDLTLVTPLCPPSSVSV